MAWDTGMGRATPSESGTLRLGKLEVVHVPVPLRDAVVRQTRTVSGSSSVP